MAFVIAILAIAAMAISYYIAVEVVAKQMFGGV